MPPLLFSVRFITVSQIPTVIASHAEKAEIHTFLTRLN
jgi:hypothetical protein